MWRKYLTVTTSIPSIFFSTLLRFSLLRVICVLTIVLICHVPTTFCSYYVLDTSDCPADQADSQAALPIAMKNYDRACAICLYVLCSFTLLHHFTSAFGPRFIVPGLIDFVFSIAEVVLFMSQATASRWVPVVPIPRKIRVGTGYCSAVALPVKIAPVEIAILWAISVPLFLLAIMRTAEALESKGRYFWTAYDITRLGPTSTRAQGTLTVIQVLTGVEVWTAHFIGEGKWIVRSRAIVAFIFIALLLAFALGALIIGPSSEADLVYMKVARIPRYRLGDQWTRPRVVIGVATESESGTVGPPTDLSPALNVTSDADLTGCSSTSSGLYSPYPDTVIRLDYTNFDCREILSWMSISVNYTTLSILLTGTVDDYFIVDLNVQVMIGHCSDSLGIIRRTQVPVVLRAGMNVLGFDQRHSVQEFSNSWLATFGLFAPSNEFQVSEIINLQSNYRALSSSNDTASLLILLRENFADLTITQDYNDKSIVKGLSSLGGLWTFLAGLFIPLFGSSLVRVVFGAKPMSIFGLAHNTMKKETQKIYRDRYPHLDSDIAALCVKPGLMALLTNHLIDLDLLSEDPTHDLSDTTIDSNVHALPDANPRPGVNNKIEIKNP